MAFGYGDYEGKGSVQKNIYVEMSKNASFVQDVSKVENIDLIFHEMSPQMQAAVQIWGAEDAEMALGVVEDMNHVVIANAD